MLNNEQENELETTNIKVIKTTAPTTTNNEIKKSKKLFQRFNSFINFYFFKNKRQFIFSILSYLFDLLLFISLNLYLLLNNNILTPKVVVSTTEQENYETTLAYVHSLNSSGRFLLLNYYYLILVI